MKNSSLLIVLAAIVVLIILGYFAYIKSSYRNKIPTSPTITASPSTPSQTACQPYQLAATIDTQGAAGNIFGTLKLVNMSKTACTVALGNTITASFDANNIVIHYQKNTPSEDYSLEPLSVAYSQFHFPNGAQCQNGVSPKKITFSYKSGQTVILFPTATHTMNKLMIQACSSQAERTTVDIWPLSKTPITP